MPQEEEEEGGGGGGRQRGGRWGWGGVAGEGKGEGTKGKDRSSRGGGSKMCPKNACACREASADLVYVVRALTTCLIYILAYLLKPYLVNWVKLPHKVAPLEHTFKITRKAIRSQITSLEKSAIPTERRKPHDIHCVSSEIRSRWFAKMADICLQVVDKRLGRTLFGFPTRMAESKPKSTPPKSDQNQNYKHQKQPTQKQKQQSNQAHKFLQVFREICNPGLWTKPF